ncbi:hypothetical protein Bca101_044957 [Brassica carinata]
MLKLKLRKRAKVREMRFEENGGILLVQRPLDSGAQSSNASSKIFNEQEIKNATKGYKETRVLGAGGQGTVDEEILSDGAEVVIPLLVYVFVSGGTLYDVLFVPVEDCGRDRPDSYHTSRGVKLDNILWDEMFSDSGASRRVPTALVRENHLSEVSYGSEGDECRESRSDLYQVALLAMSCTRVNGHERSDVRQVAEELRI